jgi:prophage regulatory protein
MELDMQQNNEVKFQTRLFRLKQVLEIIPVSETTWWAGVKSGRYPSSIRNGGMTFWRSEDIYDLVRSMGALDD